MRRLYWVILFNTLILSAAFAVNPYQLRPAGMKPVCDKSYLEIQNLPPLRDQGVYGFCYAHSTLMLLEHLRCSQSSYPSSCYKNAGSVLHLARFNTNKGQRIVAGGFPGNVLEHFRYNGRDLATESCAPYEKWRDLAKTSPPSDASGEHDYFYSMWNKLRENSSYDNKLCLANELKDAGFNQNIQELMSVIDKVNEISWKELRYKILVPETCLDQSIKYPDYDILPYPQRGTDKKDFKGLRDQIYRSLSQGHPLEASFCAETDSNGNCGYHSATIVGQRHVCDLSECRLQFRIQNSYGESWQRHNDNGWVDGENLTKLMADSGMGVTTILPKGESLNQNLTAPFYTNSPVGPGTSRSQHSSGESCWSVNTSAIENYQEPIPSSVPKFDNSSLKKPEEEETKKTVLYICKKDGQTLFTDSPTPDMDCRER